MDPGKGLYFRFKKTYQCSLLILVFIILYNINCRYSRLPPSFEITDIYDFIFDHIDRKKPCIYLLFYVQTSTFILLLLTIFPVNKIDRALHCHGKVIVLFLSYFIEL